MLDVRKPSLAMTNQTIIRSRSKASHNHRHHRVRPAKHPRHAPYDLLQPQHLPPLLRLRLLALLLDRQRPDHPSRVAYDDGPGRYRFRNHTACSYKCKCSTRQDRDNSCHCVSVILSIRRETRERKAKRHLSHSPTVEPWPIVTPPSTVTFPPNQTSCSA